MPIKASSAQEIEALVGDLSSASAVIRDAASARLTIIGGRAVGRLLVLAQSSAPGAARAAAWRTLAAIADPRTLDPALYAVNAADPFVAVAAIGVVRRFLRGRRGAEVVDRLTDTALDRLRPDAVRAAALRALRDLEPATIAPLLKSLAADPVVVLSAGEESPDTAPTLPLKPRRRRRKRR